MTVEPSAISGINPSGATQNVAVDASGRVITSSTSGGNSPVASSTAAAIASVIATTSGGLLQAANTSRKGLIAYSCTGSGAPALVAYTTSGTATSFSLALNAGVLWEMPSPLSTLGMSVIVSTSYTGLTNTILMTELS